MKRLLIAIFAGILAAGLWAYDFSTMGDSDFRDLLRSYVTAGNREYDRSSRAGIKAWADSLETALRLRSEAGMLVRDGSAEDSLEFTADLLKLRGDWHYENGNYDSGSFGEAERCFSEALSIYRKNSSLAGGLGRLPMIQREMAQLMYRTGRYAEALEYTDSACAAYVAAYDNGDFDERDGEYAVMLDLMGQRAMCMARAGDSAGALALADSLLGIYPGDSDGYYEALRKKGKILMLAGAPDADKKALDLYRQYFSWRKADALKTLATMTAGERQDYWMRIRPFVADCYRLESADPAFLYDVTLFAKGLLLQLNRLSGAGKASREALASLDCPWRRVQEALPADAAAMEIVQYEKGGRDRMGAIVLPRTGAPVWVGMTDPDTFMDYTLGVWTNRERLYTTDGSRKNNMYNDSTLRAMLWNEDLRRALGDARRIYYAPDGYFHQIALEYMLPGSMEGRDIYRLTSTRRLTEAPRLRTDSALIAGGVIYDARGVDSAEGNDAEAYAYIRGIRPSFSQLPGSLRESETVYGIRSCAADTLLTGDGVDELTFRRLCGRYPLISISTHGYFGAARVPQGTDIKPCMSDESLSQCILAMSGVNPNVSADGFDPGMTDGLLSARELAECDLSGVDLAVVSACQTGLGYVTADGVFGIQRGLKNGGVKSMVVSLWDVSDRATCLLFSRFHEGLHSGHTVHDAFMAARRSLFEAPEGASGADMFDYPQFYDAFILIDALE